ncbi:MAG: aminoglycoside phosphotransferase family protein [Pelagimonas sp.]|uniref:aminoglycoside phosphotransferase family protein n=1 Tax=Pelagimonas sp. TaxID=2073170 RepID=UPI003D6B869C
MDQLSKQAMKYWPKLAEQMGIVGGAWQISPLAHRKDERVTMVALKLVGADGRALVLKQQVKPVDPDGFAQAMQGHMAAQEVFASGVPELFAVDLEAQACVMAFVSGAPLATLLEDATIEEQAEIMRKAGQWLGEFHQATLGAPRVFQPKYTLNYLREVIQEVKDQKRQVIDPRRFLTCAEALSGRQTLFEGRKTAGAQTHGDLHMRNVLVGESVHGIDFSASREVPVGHDIGRLLSDYAILRAPHHEIRPGEVIPILVRNAFFQGYGLVGPEDPSVQLLMRHRVLAEWWGLPAQQDQRSVAQEMRWQGIKSLSDKVFPGR